MEMNEPMEKDEALKKQGELLKLCRYYKGEDECPRGHEWHPFVRFWTMERDYVVSDFHHPITWDGVRYEQAFLAWEGPILEDCRERFPDFGAFLDAGGFDAALQGMLSYMIIMSYHRMPLPADGYKFILDYGDK